MLTQNIVGQYNEIGGITFRGIENVFYQKMLLCFFYLL